MKSGDRDRSRSRDRGDADYPENAADASSSSCMASNTGHMRASLRRSRWLTLRSSLEENYGVDSWNLRAEPSPNAEKVGALSTGQAFQVLGEAEGGEWLKVHRPDKSGPSAIAYACRFFQDPSTGERVEAFVPSGAPELCERQTQSTPERRGSNAMERTERALRELTSLRHRYEQLAAKQRDVVRAQTSRKIERLMHELDFLGVPFERVLSTPDPMTLLLRGRSFQHRDFANPLAETCWLSCLFQSLWHSVVFHAAFELYLAPSKCTPKPDEKILTALQRTWAAYKEEAEEDQDDDTLDMLEPPRLVPTQDLVEGFGPGYGDMSEALASIQNELSGSSNPAAVKISELIVLVPLSTLEGSWPTPMKAWQQVVEWQVTEAPILAVDLSLPAVTQASSRHLAQLWTPRHEHTPSASRSDLGPGHRIVALVCYMWNFRHYVTFCRRQGDTSRCLFFNDLPGLTHGAPPEMEWHAVPNFCYLHNLTPRLALFESLGAAEEVVRNLHKSAAESEVATTIAAHAEGDAASTSEASARDSRDMCRHQ